MGGATEKGWVIGIHVVIERDKLRRTMEKEKKKVKNMYKQIKKEEEQRRKEEERQKRKQQELNMGF
jgi:hypothetical protein